MRRARPLSLMLALALLVGGAAACSDDDGDDAATTEESTEGGSNEEGGSDEGGADTGNAQLDEYCDKVQEFVDKSAELLDDPTNSELQTAVTDLATETGELGVALSGELASWTPEDTKRFQDCQTDLSAIGG